MNGAGPRPEFQPPESGWGFSIVGIADSDLANEMGMAIASIVKAALENDYNLSRLEGATISACYSESLADLDRGFQASSTLRPSEGHAVGVAMAAPVMRQGRVMMRLMLDASIALALLSNDEEEHAFGLCTVAHELAHIHDLATKDNAIPDTFLKPYRGTPLEAELFNMSSGAWDEFFATRMTAYLQPSSLDAFDQVLADSIDFLLAESAKARRAFFSHRDFGRAKREISAPVATFLQLSAYLIGTLDGLDRGDEYGVKSRDKLLASRFAPTFEGLRRALREMADSYPDWESLEAYAPLRLVGQQALEAEGLYLSLAPNGQVWIQIQEPDDFTISERLASRFGLPVEVPARA